MKHKGSQSDFIEQRNKELLTAYNDIIYSTPEPVSPDEVFRRLAAAPCSRLWISEERAAEVVAAMRRRPDAPMGKGMRRAMYSLLFRRTMAVLASRPGTPLSTAAAMAVRKPSPSFFLAPSSCRVIVSRLRRKRVREIRRRLLHTF